MAKKFGKFLLFTAAAGAAIAGAWYYMQNKERSSEEDADDFEDLDNFDNASEDEEYDDMDEADMGERSYVPLNYGNGSSESQDAAVPKKEPGQSPSSPDVEEFFDDEEDDGSMNAI